MKKNKKLFIIFTIIFFTSCGILNTPKKHHPLGTVEVRYDLFEKPSTSTDLKIVSAFNTNDLVNKANAIRKYKRGRPKNSKVKTNIITKVTKEDSTIIIKSHKTGETFLQVVDNAGTVYYKEKID